MKKIKNNLLKKLISAYPEKRLQIKKIYQVEGQAGLEMYADIMELLKNTSGHKLPLDYDLIEQKISELRSNRRRVLCH